MGTFPSARCRASKGLAGNIEKGTKMERKTVNLVLLVALVLYAISPVDAAPGPMDDIILFLIYAIANHKKIMPRATATVK